MSNEQLATEIAATIASDLRVEFAHEIKAGAKLTPEFKRRLVEAATASVASLANCDPLDVKVDPDGLTVTIVRRVKE
jgi:hypothetical protein